MIWLKHLVGSVVTMLLDYVSHVRICPNLKRFLKSLPEWEDISHLLSKTSIPSIVFEKKMHYAKSSKQLDTSCVFVRLQASHGLCSTCADW